jgi:hypothetical protein
MWMHQNTRDEPGESHVDTFTIAKVTGLSEERVKSACMRDKRIFVSSEGTWSVWRKDPQSIYENRGIITV